MKIALLFTDNRENYRKYEKIAPYFHPALEALLEGFAQLPDVEVHVISCAQKRMQSPQKIAANIFFYSLYTPKIGWLRTGYQGCIRAVRKKLKEIQPDIVHGHGTERNCAISAVFSGFPNVITIHGNMRIVARINHSPPFSFNWLAARIERFVLPRTDGIICISNHTRQQVVHEARRTWVVPNAQDSRFFNVNNTLDKNRTILCIGTICLLKNQNQMIRALLNTEEKFNVIFYGDFNDKDPYVKEFFKLIEQNVGFQLGGFLDRDNLLAALEKATMLVLPSLEDNCPMAVLEAMAAGVPVVAAKVGGLPDLIEEDVTGVFCDPLDPSSIQKGVLKLWKDTFFARQIALRAKEKAWQRFHPTVIAAKHLEIYTEVLTLIQKSS